MTHSADFEDRLAARLLGVDLDADATQIRGQFRRLAKAVHPDRAVEDACIDLGRLAEAKDRLVTRAERVARADRDMAEMNARLVAAQAARETALAEADRARREQEAARRVEAMRATPAPETPIEAFRAAAVDAEVVRTRFEPLDRRGLLVDLAG